METEQEGLELILEDMTEWLETYVLEGEKFFEHLDRIEDIGGEDARGKRLAFLTEKYWREHIVH